MDRAAAELFLASLYVEVTPERDEALGNAFKAVRNWEGLVPALEAHGLLALFVSHQERIGFEPPPNFATTLLARNSLQREDDQRSQLSLVRFLAAARREGIELTAVGASALCLDLYPESQRRLGELELMVAPEHMPRAMRAGEQAGLLLAEGALPVWWYRRTHTALPLAPSSSLLGRVRLRSTLHHPSLLLTAREPEVLGRRRRIEHGGHELFLLDPIDGLLELATRVAMRAGESLLIGGRRNLILATSSPCHELSLDQILDLRTHIERHHAELPLDTVLARAREWSAEPALRAVLECLQMGLGFQPGAREWVLQAAHGLANPTKTNPSAPALALFRPDPFERLPQWLRPSDTYLAKRYGVALNGPTPALRAARARHLIGLLGHGAFATLGFPTALLARRLARTTRRAAWQGAQTPLRQSDVTQAWQAATLAEQQKPVLPTPIALPEREANAPRFPDHYSG